MNQTMTEHEALNQRIDKLEKLVLESLAQKQANERVAKSWTPKAVTMGGGASDLNGKFPSAHDQAFSRAARHRSPAELDQMTKDILNLSLAIYGQPENFSPGESLPRKAARCIGRLKEELQFRTDESNQLKTNLAIATAPVTEFTIVPKIAVAVNVTIPEPTDPEVSRSLKTLSGEIAEELLENVRDALTAVADTDE